MSFLSSGVTSPCSASAAAGAVHDFVGAGHEGVPYRLVGAVTPLERFAAMLEADDNRVEIELYGPPKRTTTGPSASLPQPGYFQNGLGERFDRAAKYVVTGGKQRLDWQNSHRLESLDAIAELKRGEGPRLVIQGSGTLYPQLLRAGLLDRLMLMSFPVIIGSGKRLFAEGTPPGAMRMVEHQITPSGNIIATYQPHGAIEIGSFQQPEPSAAELGRREKVKQGTW